MDYNRMKTRPINLGVTRPKINKGQIKRELMWIHNNCAFSVYSYCGKKVTEGVSKRSVQQTGTGNCIGLCYGLKSRLKQKYGVNSYVIPATVPEHIKKEGYLDISHVALMIPGSRVGTFYIADPAFYFVEPIKVDLKKWNYPNYFVISNVYSPAKNNKEQYLSRTNILTEDYTLNKYQTISKSTPVVVCSKDTGWQYNSFGSSDWSYFVTEIINPDLAITSFFMKVWKDKPFITRTSVEKGQIIITFSIHRYPSSSITIKKRLRIIYEGKVEDLTERQINTIDNNFKIPKITGPKFKKYLLKGENCDGGKKN